MNEFLSANNSRLKYSESCLSLIKRFEGYAKSMPDGSAKAYLDPVGIWTIGYGSIRNFDDQTPIREGDVISKETAERWLREEVEQTSVAVRELCKAPLSQSMFDALISFGYNIGTGGGGLRTSTLLRKLNNKDYIGAAEEFGRWVQGEVQGERVVLPGLVERRKAEEELFKKDLDHMFPSIEGKSENEWRDKYTKDIKYFPYRPAPLPLPFNRLLEKTNTGEDCLILNCALAGLGLLRVGPQPDTFTNETEEAVRVFQRLNRVQVNGQVGSTTRKVIEQSLRTARSLVPPRAPDRPYCKLTRTRKPTYENLELCALEFINAQSKIEGTLQVISGTKEAQLFKLLKDRNPVNMEPIPQGRYAIGNIDWANGKDNYNFTHIMDGEEIGPAWVDLHGEQEGEQPSFGFHADWGWIKKQHSAGSPGCVCPTSLNDLKTLVRLLREHNPRLLVVDWGL